MATNKKIIIKKISGELVQSLIARLKKIKNISNVEYIVFKVDPAIKEHLEKDPQDRKQIVTRANGVDVYLLALNDKFSQSLFHINTESLRCINKEKLEEIRRADFLDILERTGGEGLHIAGEGIHYQTPSGKHTKAFLRLADVVHSLGQLDRISYWLLEELDRVEAVLVDNWSLASIILYSQIRLKKEIRFDCLRQHLNSKKEDAFKIIKKLFGDLKKGDHVLLFVSVNTSGEHYTALIEMCKKVRPDLEYTSASAYQMPYNEEDSSHSPEIFCKLDDLDNKKMLTYTQQNCPYCENNEKLLYIDKRYYYPIRNKEKPISLPANPPEYSAIRLHFELISKIDEAFCVHRDDPNDENTPRHHAFYIDVVKLVENQSFKKKFIEKWKELKNNHGDPDVIIHPPHTAAKKLLELIEDQCNRKKKVIAAHRLRDICEKNKKYLKSCKHICILDDVVITGGRIKAYVQDIRTKISPGKLSLENLSVLVALQRTENENKLMALKNGVLSNQHSWNSELYAATKLFLPNWDEKSCPWCKEAEIWAKAGDLYPFDEPPYFNSRRAALNLSDTCGITDSPIPKFIDPDSVQKLGAGSPLGESGMGEMPLLFKISVLLQIKRFDKDPEKRLARDFEINNVLACGEEKNTLDRYSESLIQACLLRCAKPSDWASDMNTYAIPELIKKLDDESAVNVLLLEIMFYLTYRPSCKSENIDKLEKCFNEYKKDEIHDPALSILHDIRNSHSS